jgi:hypothetical protein
MVKKILEGRSSTFEKSHNGTVEVKKGINPKLFDDFPVYINYKCGFTISDNRYGSKRVDIGFTVPCDNNPIAIKRTFNKIVKQTHKLLKEEEAEIRRQIKEDTSCEAELEFEE